MSASRNITIGKAGEDLACRYIEELGYKVINRNWHFSKNSEIDIIAKDKNTLVFIEVKTRTSQNFGHPLEAITKNKLEKIFTAVLAYINQCKIDYKSYRIDAISIIGLSSPKIEHIKNISLN